MATIAANMQEAFLKLFIFYASFKYLPKFYQKKKMNATTYFY